MDTLHSAGPPGKGTQNGDRFRLLFTRKINQGSTLEEPFERIENLLRVFVPSKRVAVALLGESGERLSIIAAKSDGKVASFIAEFPR